VNVARITAIAALLASMLTAAAGAHVTISPKSVAGGGVAELTFRCPNERPNAAITGLVVQLPEDASLRVIKLRPIAGWHATVTTRKFARPFQDQRGEHTTTDDTIAWSGGRIPPGRHQDFQILAGPLPHGPTKLVFKAIQTYANGEIVRWIQVAGPGEAAPPQPAPILTIR
jgi:uncharacterized protein YcnI